MKLNNSKIKLEQPMKAIFITFICLLIYSIFMVKMFGATDVTLDVEKNGYCKQYGDEWRNIRETNTCSKKGDQIEFTEQEFRDYCPDHKFFSTKFYSDCFYKSGSIA